MGIGEIRVNASPARTLTGVPHEVKLLHANTPISPPPHAPPAALHTKSDSPIPPFEKAI